MVLDKVINTKIRYDEIQKFQLGSNLETITVLRKPDGIETFKIEGDQLKSKYKKEHGIAFFENEYMEIFVS